MTDNGIRVEDTFTSYLGYAKKQTWKINAIPGHEPRPVVVISPGRGPNAIILLTSYSIKLLSNFLSLYP